VAAGRVHLELVHKWTLDNYDKLFSGQGGLWLRIFGRTVLLAAIVTLLDAALAFPLAGSWPAGRRAGARSCSLAVVVPLWSSILVGSSPGARPRRQRC
jgi:ABC-type spermidine/putrescine transport system permease subunit I